MTGRAKVRAGAEGVTFPTATAFFFSYYYFTSICPSAEEVLS